MAFRPSITRGLALSCILTSIPIYTTLGIFVNVWDLHQNNVIKMLDIYYKICQEIPSSDQENPIYSVEIF